MNLSSLPLPSSLQSLVNRPARLLLIVGIVVVLWAGWIGQKYWIDQELPEEALQAQQLRVNTTQLEGLNKSLGLYHQPTTPGSPLPSVPFRTPSTR